MVNRSVELGSRVEGLTVGHEVGRIRTQLDILRRAEAALASGWPTGDPLGAYEDQLTSWETSHLGQIIAEEIAVLKLNQDLDADPGRIIVRATDFGVVGDGAINDGPALRAALRSATAKPNATLLLPPGRIRISDFDPARAGRLLCIFGARNFTWLGNGCELIGEPASTLLHVEESSNVRLRDMILDFDPQPTTEGLIVAVDREARAIEVDIDAGLGLPVDAPFSTARVRVMLHRADGRLAPHSHESFGDARSASLGGRRVRLTAHALQKPLRADVQVGNRVSINSRGPSPTRKALVLAYSRFIDCQGVTLHGSHDFTVLVEGCTGTTFRESRIVPREGRTACVNADGFHCRSNRHGPRFEACEVAWVHDDCANLYSRAMSVAKVLGPRQLLLDACWEGKDRADHFQPEKRDLLEGDLLMLIDPALGEPHAQVMITGTAPHAWAGSVLVAVTVDKDLPPLRSREDLGLGRVSDGAEFLEVAKERQLEHFAVPLSTKSDGFAIVDCKLGQNTVAGVKVKASNGVISRNHFRDHGWCCISLHSEMMWQEGHAPRRILIQGNRFENWYGLHAGTGYPGGRAQIGARFVRELQIRDNDFIGVAEGERAVHLDAASDCTVAGNRSAPPAAVCVGANCARISTDT